MRDENTDLRAEFTDALGLPRDALSAVSEPFDVDASEARLRAALAALGEDPGGSGTDDGGGGGDVAPTYSLPPVPRPTGLSVLGGGTRFVGLLGGATLAVVALVAGLRGPHRPLPQDAHDSVKPASAEAAPVPNNVPAPDQTGPAPPAPGSPLTRSMPPTPGAGKPAPPRTPAGGLTPSIPVSAGPVSPATPAAEASTPADGVATTAAPGGDATPDPASILPERAAWVEAQQALVRARADSAFARVAASRYDAYLQHEGWDTYRREAQTDRAELGLMLGEGEDAAARIRELLTQTAGTSARAPLLGMLAVAEAQVDQCASFEPIPDGQGGMAPPERWLVRACERAASERSRR